MIWTTCAFAATISVSNTTDLQAALDDASDGDILRIATDYVPSDPYVEYSGKDLTIVGDGGVADIPPIHAYDGSMTLRRIRIQDSGNDVWPILVYATTEAEVARLYNVQLIGNHERAAFQSEGAGSLDVEIHRSDFTDNGGDGTIQLAWASLLVSNSTFTDNENWGDGGAIWTKEATSVTIEWSDFSANSSKYNGGGALAFTEGGGSPVLIHASTFSDNFAETDGGHIYVDDHELALTYVAAMDGEAERGGFLFTQNVSALTIDDLALHRPKASKTGGAFYITDCTSVRFTRSQICAAENSSEEYGQAAMMAVQHYSELELSMTNTVVQGTRGGTYSPGVLAYVANIELVNTTFADNPNYGAIFQGQTLTGLRLENNILDGASGIVDYAEWTGGDPEGSNNLFDGLTSSALQPAADLASTYLDDPDALIGIDPAYVTEFEATDCGTRPYLREGSPAIDAGVGTDPDSSPADLGAFGGASSDDMFVFPEHPGGIDSADSGLDSGLDESRSDSDAPVDDSAMAADTAATPGTSTWLSGGCGAARGGAGFLAVLIALLATAKGRLLG